MTQPQIQLVTAARSGDVKSFEELYVIYHGKIYALARMILKNEANAEDVLQDTFITAWRKLNTLKEPATFSVWLQIIAKNLCNDQLRKKNIAILLDSEKDIENFDDEETEELLPAIYTERADLKERLGRIIDRLSDVQRQSIVLYYYNGLDVGEISEVMECGINTVKTRLYLARKTIRSEIEEQERKSGERFFGIMGIPTLPFGRLMVSQMEAMSISQGAAGATLGAITDSIAKTTGEAVKTMPKAAKAIIAVAAVAIVGIGAFVAVRMLGGNSGAPETTAISETSEAATVENHAGDPDITHPGFTPYDLSATLLEPDGNFATPGSVRLAFKVDGLEEQPLLHAMILRVEKKIGEGEWYSDHLHPCSQFVEENKVAQDTWFVDDTWRSETPWSEELTVMYRAYIYWDDLEAGRLGFRGGYSEPAYIAAKAPRVMTHLTPQELTVELDAEYYPNDAGSVIATFKIDGLQERYPGSSVEFCFEHRLDGEDWNHFYSHYLADVLRYEIEPGTYRVPLHWTRELDWDAIDAISYRAYVQFLRTGDGGITGNTNESNVFTLEMEGDPS